MDVFIEPLSNVYFMPVPFLNRLPPPSECELYYVNRDTLFSYNKDSEIFLQVTRASSKGHLFSFHLAIHQDYYLGELDAYMSYICSG